MVRSLSSCVASQLASILYVLRGESQKFKNAIVFVNASFGESESPRAVPDKLQLASKMMGRCK